MKKTRLGISSYSFPYAVGNQGIPDHMPEKRLDAFGLVDKAAALGVPVLQIADNCPLHELNREKISELSRYARQKGIELEVGMRGLIPEKVREYLEICSILKSSLLRIVIDSEGDEPDTDEIVSRIHELLPYLEKKKVVLGIENHDRLTSETFREIMERCESSYVGMVLDTVNSFGCEEGTWQVVNELAPYTVNFHMKDFQISRIASKLGFEITGTIAGEGRLQFTKLLEVFGDKAKSDYSTILELWMKPEDTIEKTLEKENCWVEKSIFNLKEMLSDHRQFLR